jgi:hypothetical protein
MMKSALSINEAEFRRCLINTFIVFFLFSTIVWNLPRYGLRAALIKPVHKAMVLLGMEQFFFTFAPDPPTRESSLHAEIAYDDGSSALWTFPTAGQTSTMGGYLALSHSRAYWGHYLSEHLKKCPEIISYILHDSSSFAGARKPVAVKVLVRKHSASILDPKTGNVRIPESVPDMVVFDRQISSSSLVAPQ